MPVSSYGGDAPPSHGFISGFITRSIELNVTPSSLSASSSLGKPAVPAPWRIPSVRAFTTIRPSDTLSAAM